MRRNFLICHGDASFHTYIRNLILDTFLKLVCALEYTRFAVSIKMYVHLQKSD